MNHLVSKIGTHLTGEIKMQEDHQLFHLEEGSTGRELKWDIRFMKLAKFWALENSKDPSTKCAAIITKEINKVVSLGYNGFPSRFRDHAARLTDRDVKYRCTLHAEENAVLWAQEPLKGCTVYTWPFQPCAHCASLLSQAGIYRIVSIPPSQDICSRWGQDIDLAQVIMSESSISLRLLTSELVGVDNWGAICNDVRLVPREG